MGIGVDGFVLEQLASSYSVLSEDEKELGCVYGYRGGTTDIAVFNSGSISFTGVIPIAGDQVKWHSGCIKNSYCSSRRY